LTPIMPDVVRTINQEEFRGFSFINLDYNPAKYHGGGDSKNKS